MKSAILGALSAVLSLALVLSGAPAHASGRPSFDVTKLSGDSITVSSWKCVKTEVRMSHKKSNVDWWDVDTEILSPNGYADSTWFSDSSGPKKRRVQICPSLSGLGKYTLGPSEIVAYGTDWSMLERADKTKGSFYVRGKVTASLSAKRSGGKVTLSSKTRRYDPESYGWANYNPTVKFQVKSGGKWKTIKKVKAKKGKASYVVKQRSKKSYRVVVDQISWASGATSKTVAR